MMEELIQILGTQLELTATDIADLLWLTLERHQRETRPSSSENQIQKNVLEKNSPLVINQSSPITSTTVEKTTSESKPSSVEVYASTSTIDQANFNGYLPLSVADARSVRKPLDFIRALKPLLKKVASSTQKVINEAATVDWIAQTNLWIPQFQPSLEPWLELALVIDESKSMLLWQHTVKELQRILKHYGMFRDVRVWGLSQDLKKQIYLRSQTNCHSPKIRRQRQGGWEVQFGKGFNPCPCNFLQRPSIPTGRM